MKKISVIVILSSLSLLFAFVSAGVAEVRDDSSMALENARQKIMEEFARIDMELKRAAERLGAAGLTGYGARSALEDLYNAFPYAVDCAAVDAEGIMVTIEPAPFRHYEGKDISGQEQVKRMLDRRKPVLSDAFLTVEGVEATDVEYPVITDDGTFLGSVSLLFIPEKLLAGLFPAAAGKTPDISVMETGGRILYHADPDRIGMNLLASDRFKTDKNLRRLGERLAAEQDGKDTAENAAWLSVDLYDTFWRLVVFK